MVTVPIVEQTLLAVAPSECELGATPSTGLGGNKLGGAKLSFFRNWWCSVEEVEDANQRQNHLLEDTIPMTTKSVRDQEMRP